MDYCVDVVYLNRGDYPSYANFLGGKGNLGQRIPVMSDFAGSLPTENWFSEETDWGKKVNYPLQGYGSSKLPRQGDYVIVAFLDENFSAPIILGSIHPFWRSMNITGESEEGLEDQEGPTEKGVTNEIDRFIDVFPPMVWQKVNKDGEMEISFPFGKGFAEREGFFIKIGHNQAGDEAINVLNTSIKTHDKLSELSDVLEIGDIPEVQTLLSKVISRELTISEAADAIRGLPEARVILTGDPHMETPPNLGGCVCGSTGGSCGSSSVCTCGATTWTGEIDPETEDEIEQGYIVYPTSCPKGTFYSTAENPDEKLWWSYDNDGTPPWES